MAIPSLPSPERTKLPASDLLSHLPISTAWLWLGKHLHLPITPHLQPSLYTSGPVRRTSGWRSPIVGGVWLLQRHAAPPSDACRVPISPVTSHPRLPKYAVRIPCPASDFIPIAFRWGCLDRRLASCNWLRFTPLPLDIAIGEATWKHVDQPSPSPLNKPTLPTAPDCYPIKPQGQGSCVSPSLI